MPMREIQGFVTDGPTGKYLPLNMYWEPDYYTGEPAMISTPGISNVSAMVMGTGCIRNMLAFNDVLYAVGSSVLYSSTGGAATSRGTGIGTSSSPYWVSMAINYDASGNYELAITDGQNTRIWYYNIGSDTFSYASAPDSITPTNVTYLKQVFVVGESGGNRVYCSGIDDATAWSALDFSSKTAKPDRVTCVMAVNQDLWVFGETSTEIWYYTAAASGLPFALMGGGVLDVGCISPASVAVMDNSVYWLNNRCEVCRSTGYSYEVISPPILNDLLQGYASGSTAYVTNAIGYSILWEGHPFYVLQLPVAQKTYVFDAIARSTGQRGWYQWSSGSTTGRHYSNCAALFKGDLLAGGYTGGKIYQLSDSIYTDDGANNYRRKYGAMLFGGGEMARINRLVVQGSFPATGTGNYLRLTVGSSSYDAPSLTSPVRWSGLGAETSILPSLTYYGSGMAVINKVFADISVGGR